MACKLWSLLGMPWLANWDVHWVIYNRGAFTCCQLSNFKVPRIGINNNQILRSIKTNTFVATISQGLITAQVSSFVEPT